VAADSFIYFINYVHQIEVLNLLNPPGLPGARPLSIVFIFQSIFCLVPALEYEKRIAVALLLQGRIIYH